MATTPDSLRVDYGHYLITECGESPHVDVISAAFRGNTLVAADEDGMYVLCGTHYGEVEVVVALAEEEPAELPAGFGAVVDLSFRSGSGRMFVLTWEGMSHPRQENLAHAGPGWYRIRIAARDRERYGQPAPPQPEPERHQVTIWPTTGPAEDRVHRMDRRHGGSGPAAPG
jgi:hypothetical protein